MGARVRALPYSTGGRRDIDRVGRHWVDGNIHDTASNVRRPDELPWRCAHLRTRLAGNRGARCGPEVSCLDVGFFQGAGGNSALSHALGEERILGRGLYPFALAF